MSARSSVEKQLASVMETLAAIEHERWSTWQRYMHDHGIRQPDGALLLPADLVARWDRQLHTPYEQLTEAEKDSDREQVELYLPVIRGLFERDGGLS